MTHFKEFLIKLQTLDIKVVQRNSAAGLSQERTAFYDISHQNPYVSDQFRNELKELRELALTDLLNLPLDQIELQLKRLNEIKASFASFWKNVYSSAVPAGSEHNNSFLYSLQLNELFIVPELSHQNGAIANDQFIDDLQDSIRSRQKVLKEFVQSVVRVISLDHTKPEAASTKQLQQREKARPVFKEAAAGEFFDLLKDYFTSSEQQLLKTLLTSGTNPGMPLLFKGKGNQLADAFKQLFEANLIVGCNKTELIHWILQHFTYLDKGEVRNYSGKYLQDLVASNTKSCQSPILDVRKKEGQFFIFSTQRNNRSHKF